MHFIVLMVFEEDVYFLYKMMSFGEISLPFMTVILIRRAMNSLQHASIYLQLGF